MPVFQQVLILIVFSCTLTYAQESPLEESISLRMQDTPLQTVLTKMEKLTSARFLYNPDAIGVRRKVSVRAHQEPLRLVLDRLFRPLSIHYELIRGNLILTAQDSVPQVQETFFRGMVKNSKGEPISDAFIRIKGSLQGTTTQADGSYQLSGSEPATLLFSHLSYQSTQIMGKPGLVPTVILQETTVALPEIAIVGSYASPRLRLDRSVPVDVLTSDQLQATGQLELAQQLQFTSPTVQTLKTGINGVANYADPITLRGLAPDQVLVLVDGKRRHPFSGINLNQTVGLGTVTTDLNAIPTLALERVEILRDGAAAQYGSDAIAGIINLVLRKETQGGLIRSSVGSTSRGDGTFFTTGLRWGTGLGKAGSNLTLSLQVQSVGVTNRSDAYTGRIYASDSTTDNRIRQNRGVWQPPFRVGIYGSNGSTTVQGLYKISYPVHNYWTFYQTGSYSNKYIVAYGFFRNAIPDNANSNPDLYPDGYTPELPGRTVDFSQVIGLSRQIPQGWQWDFSGSYGSNRLDLWANHTSNPSLGAISPTDFYVGRSYFAHTLVDATATRLFHAPNTSWNVALGSQFRRSEFQLRAGDAAASEQGPLMNKAPGASGRPGIARADEVRAFRSNLGLYGDVEGEWKKRILGSIALRLESYSDFGSNLSGKTSIRYRMNSRLSVRGSINRGFRAPSLQQNFNRLVTSTVQAGSIALTRQISSQDPRMAELGFPPIQAEKSWNYTLGLAGEIQPSFTFALDAYQISIRDRIILSDRLFVASIASLQRLFPELTEVRLFTNQLSTRTKGLDAQLTYSNNRKKNTFLRVSAIFSYNQTQITRIKPTPAAFQEGTASAISLIDTIGRGLIETAQPREKFTISGEYRHHHWSGSVRATYIGAVTGWIKPLTQPYESQTFRGKTLFDVTIEYTPTQHWQFSLMGLNLLNTYPDRILSNQAAYSNGQTPYPRNVSQFSANGASGQLQVAYRF